MIPTAQNATTTTTAAAAPARLAMTPLTWTMLVVLALMWGCTFFFNSIALADIPPASLIALRVGGGAIVLWLVVLARGLAVPTGAGVLGGLLAMGAANNVVPFLLIAWGQQHIAGGLAAVIVAMTPIFTVVVAHWMTDDERITRARLAGVAAGLAGVVVLIGPGVLLSLGADFGIGLAAQLAVLAAAVSYAWSGVFARRFMRRGIPLISIAAVQISMAALLVVPLALAIDRPWTLAPPGAAAWAGVAGLVLSSTAVAYMLYFAILQRAGATNLLLVNFLVPVSAILLGTLVLGEVLLPRHFAGMALIALGLAAIDGSLWRRLRRRKR
jgi:drug/metabolite transporter (DMT)-like permease